MYKTNKQNNMSDTDKKINQLWKYYKNLFDDIYNPRSFSNKRKSKIKARLETYTVDELKEALDNMRANDYICGKNENNRVYAKPEYCFRNDEKVEEWLNVGDNNDVTADEDYEIPY